MISDTDYMAKYLNEIRVLFDEEAEKYIEEHGGDSGSWQLEVQTGKVYYV
jgi:Fe-S cluster biogenesis protein NfuA